MRRNFALSAFLILVLVLGIVVAKLELPDLEGLLGPLKSAKSVLIQTLASLGSEKLRSKARSKVEPTFAKKQNAGTPNSVYMDPGVALDIARLSLRGPSVFAGRAPPFAHISLLDEATVVATALANANGDWSLVTDYKFASGEPHIGLRINYKSGDNSALAANVDSTSRSSASDQKSPAARLLKDFEAMVATAREEAPHQNRTADPINGPNMNLVVSTTASSERLAEIQRQEVARSPDLPSSARSATPIPITFIYNEATLTTEGLRSARLLLEYLHLKKFSAVTLSGHADERGLPNFNMELSRQRLLAIERFLHDGGYQGKLDLLPKGSMEPYMGVDRSLYPYEELMQLDRRVELRTAK